MIEVMEPGLTQGNLLVTISIVSVLILLSEKYRVLDRTGVYAAAALGITVGALGHWTWLVILLGFWAQLTRQLNGDSRKKLPRDFPNQVMDTEVGVMLLPMVVYQGLVAIIAFFMDDHENGLWLFSAAVAVAAADTFASEIGCLDDRVRMITTMKKCEPGLNGGFSPNGQIAAFVGAAIIAILAFFSEQNLELAGMVALIGWLGCQVDSVLGAVLENRGFMTKGTVNAAAITFGIIAMWWYQGFPHL